MTKQPAPVATDLLQPGNTWRVRLSDGSTHIVDQGPADATPFMLVHGATVPHWSFDRLVPYLLAAGFRVIRFDLYGHGHSSRPRNASYSLTMFVRQAREVIEFLQLRRIHVLGYSMGAVITAALHGEKNLELGRLILAAPLLEFRGLNPWATVARIPGIGEALIHAAVVPGLKRRRRNRYHAIGQPHLARRFDDHATRPGFAGALLSMIRNGVFGHHLGLYETLGSHCIEPLILWGEDDSIISAEDIAHIRACLPTHEYRAMEGIDHCLMLTHPAEVAQEITKFLNP